MSLSLGTRLGPYEVLALLGAGGMGEVYRARDSQLGRDVALKVLANLTSDSDRLRRFEQEARAAAVRTCETSTRTWGGTPLPLHPSDTPTFAGSILGGVRGASRMGDGQERSVYETCRS